MDLSSDTISWLILGAVLLCVFGGGAWVVKRFFIDKKYYGGAQFVGRQIYEEFQHADRREAIEHVIYMEEEERQQDFSADDNSPDNGDRK